jgi:hypothetical protein
MKRFILQDIYMISKNQNKNMEQVAYFIQIDPTKLKAFGMKEI